ncbi:MAG TPA: hypothetical protein VGO80_22760 [Solirubrobacteraceae bacterium]|nr:hypothetical protein [Solirubrobacteraceae bacterium]
MDLGSTITPPPSATRRPSGDHAERRAATNQRPLTPALEVDELRGHAIDEHHRRPAHVG